MNIATFRKQLGRSSLGPGGTWMKSDFHIHAPSSTDYEYKEPDASEKLGHTLESAGYRFAVILKHEQFPTREELQLLQRHCPNTTLIPGAEINVIVDALFKKIGKDYFFHCIVAVDPASSGDYGYPLQRAMEELTYRPGEYPAGFRSSIVDVAKFFQENGALFIPAHLHQSKPPENSRSIDDLYEDDAFLDFVKDGAFTALEVRAKSTAEFFSGSKTTTEGLPIPAAVCVASSDAHRHDHITSRKRATWVRAEKATFAELRAALTFPHRVLLAEPQDGHARICGIHVVGSFLPDTWVNLNSGMNALIGAKGSGKTALIECVRFALNTRVPPDRAEAVKRHVDHVLGASGYVECLVTQSDGTQMLITRRADSPDRISLQNERDEVTTVDIGGEVGFPISILGWHEIEAVADKAEARISLLDRAGDSGAIRSLYADIGRETEIARDELPLLQRDIKRLDKALHELWDLKKKRAALQRLEQSELITLQHEYEWHLSAEQQIAGLRESLRTREGQLPAIVGSNITLNMIPPPETERANTLRAVMAEVETALASTKESEERSLADMRVAVGAAVTVAASAAEKLQAGFQTFREAVYTPKVNALPPDDREILTRQIQILEETKRLPVAERTVAALLNKAKSKARTLKTHCDAIVNLRNQIADKRRGLVEALNAELSGVRLAFLRSANNAATNGFQQKYGEEGAIIVEYVGSFGKRDSFENLSELFSRLVQITQEQDRWDVTPILYDVKFVDFLDIIDDDDIEISLDVGKAGLVPIQNLSAGQRSVAVFPLLLRNSKGPLVVDQPEDNLDNRYIADIISRELRDRKVSQQYLVTSHNANLVVLTDADLIVHVDSDGKQASFPASGFFACEHSIVKRSVLDVLDGGAAALRARQRKYGGPA